MTGRYDSSAESSEALSYRRLMMSRHVLQTRSLPGTPNFSPDMMDVQLESKMQPHVRQWCLRRKAVNWVPQRKHSRHVSSAIQNSLLRTCLRMDSSLALTMAP